MTPRHDWTLDQALALMARPFLELVFDAQTTHRAHFAPSVVERAQLLSIKTGGCAENCGYCAQSAQYAKATGVKATRLMAVDKVLAEAARARAGGASRYCMGAAWTQPKDRDLDAIVAMIEGVKALGMETCMTLGMLEPEQARRLAEAGLDYYNHNIDTGAGYYGEIVTTRSQQDRLDTLGHVRDAGIHVCSGGIVGMGEQRADRAEMLVTLANLSPQPESVPINRLVKVKGTPLADSPELDILEFIRTIATARIMMPASVIRLSAGRETMSDAEQALALLAGANSVFVGDKLLTTANPGEDRDGALFAALGLKPGRPAPAAH